MERYFCIPFSKSLSFSSAQNAQTLTNKLTGLSLLALLAVNPASADVMDDVLSEEAYFDEIPIVTSATRLKQSLNEAPAAITVITREMITASGITEISELLALAPGFVNYHITGNWFGVTRGLGVDFPGDLEIMIDGRSVYEPFFSSVEWSSVGIDVADIEYIEVVRGSNAPAYGSNALLGAINIVTSRPLGTENTRVRVTGAGGDIDVRNVNLLQRLNLGALGLEVGINYKENEGFAPAKPFSRPIDRIIDGTEQLHLRVNGVYTPDLNNTLEFQIGVGDSEFDNPSNSAFLPEGFTTRESDSSFQLVRWTHKGEKDEWQFQLYHNRLELTETEAEGLASELLGAPVLGFLGQPDQQLKIGLDEDLSERYDLEIQHSLNISDKQRLVWGVGSRYDRVRSDFFLGDVGTVDEIAYRAFFNWEYLITSKLRMNLGVMGEKNNIVADFLSPRLGFNYSFNDHHTLRASVTRGNRTPSVIEANTLQSAFFADGTPIDIIAVADPRLDKTQVKEFEVGYLGHFFKGRLSVDMRFFRSDLEDGIREVDITSAPGDILLPDTEQVTNAIDYDTEGFELQTKYKVTDKWFAYLTYTTRDQSGKVLDKLFPALDIDEIGFQLPKHVVTFLTQVSLGQGWDASAIWYYRSESSPLDGNRVVDNFDRLDLRLAKEMKFGDSTLTAEVIGQNVFNERYINYEERFVFESTVYGRLTLSF